MNKLSNDCANDKWQVCRGANMVHSKNSIWFDCDLSGFWITSELSVRPWKSRSKSNFVTLLIAKGKLTEQAMPKHYHWLHEIKHAWVEPPILHVIYNEWVIWHGLERERERVWVSEAVYCNNQVSILSVNSEQEFVMSNVLLSWQHCFLSRVQC